MFRQITILRHHAFALQPSDFPFNYSQFSSSLEQYGLLRRIEKFKRPLAWNLCTRLFHQNPPLFGAQEKSQTELSLYNSLSDQIQTLGDEQEKALAWYTCGPTTYAPAHMGHARTYVCLDILRRVLEWQSRGNRRHPLFVMNITDVDDKILAAAKETGQDPIQLARSFEACFWKDLDSLNCLRPHIVTRVTEHVESDIIPFIQEIVDQGIAYIAEDGVYFHVQAFNEKMGLVTKYGKLAPPAASQEFFSTSAVGGEVADSIKRDPRDFVLWKREKPGELLSWPSPWGSGRPGWHIECSAMIEAVQKKFRHTHRFKVHAGGIDLKFPHHTNEIAQAEAFSSGKEWIPHWVHTGHLHIDGLKMSKSLKNFVSIQDFLNEFDNSSSLESPADDFRLWCLGLSGSYRGAATFSRARIAEARSIRQKLVRFLMEGETWKKKAQSAPKKWTDVEFELFQAAIEAHQECMYALMNDLDGATFVAKIVRVSESGINYISENSEGGPTEPMSAILSMLRELLSLVGFSEKTTQIGLRTESLGMQSHNVVGGEDAVIDELVRFRSTVRRAALEDAHNKVASENMKRILRACDDARDNVFPNMGIELFDARVDEQSDGWRFCLPKSPSNNEGGGKQKVSPYMDFEYVPLGDFFRVGQYEGLFAEFDNDGVPTRNADGSELSKSKLKKLLKKREAHRQRLEGRSLS